MTKYKIPVTQQDIDEGRPRDCENCMVSCAMRRAGLAGVSTSIGSVRFIDRKGVKRRASLPENARRSIRDYDFNSCVVGPFMMEFFA